jgi:hypothetical protein
MPRISVCVDEETHAILAVLLDGERHEDVEVVRERQHAPPANSAVVLEFCPRAHTGADLQLDRALRCCTRPRALAVVPWRQAWVPPGAAFADLTAYVLPASAAPERHSFFPVNWRYAAGLAMVEIEPIIDETTSAALSAEYFMTRQFQELRGGIEAALRGPNTHGSMPGFILPDTAKHLAAHAHAGVAAHDPLLAQFRPDYVRTSVLKLQADDYVAFCSSTWSTVSKETKAIAGHAEGARHYYAVVKMGLPPECVDQLKMLVFCNPNGDSWAKLVARKPFQRALDTARALRAKMLTEALGRAGLQPRKSNPHVVDSATDVFDETPVHVPVTSGGEVEGVTFYSGCTPTHRAARGVLTEVGPERDAGLLWLHGPPSEKVGGEAWKQPASVHSLPAYATARATKATLDGFAAAGWVRKHGYAKLEPIVFV